MLWGLVYFCYEQRLRDLELFILRSKRLRGDFININVLWEYQEDHTRLFSTVHSDGQGAKDTSWNTGISLQTWGGILLLWEWQSNGTICSETLWIVLFRHSKSTWTLSCVTYCRQPAIAVGLDSMISWSPFQPLQFLDSVINVKYFTWLVFLLTFRDAGLVKAENVNDKSTGFGKDAFFLSGIYSFSFRWS